MTSTEPLDLDAIEKRASRLHETVTPREVEGVLLASAMDVPALVAEVRRLRALVSDLNDYTRHAPKCWGSEREKRPCDCGFVEVTARADEIERGA